MRRALPGRRQLPNRIAAVAAFLAAALLMGCARLSVTCGIDADMSALLAYECVLDPSGLRPEDAGPAQWASEAVAHSLTEKGFTVSTSFSQGKSWTIRATKRQVCGSTAEAADTLRGWLTDKELSPFDTACVRWLETEYEQACYLAVTMDLTTLLAHNDAASFPADIAALYAQGVAGFSGSLTLLLPGDEIADGEPGAALAGGVARCDAPLSLTGPAAASLMTVMEKQGGSWSQRQGVLEERAARADHFIPAAAAAFAALLATALALGIALRRRP